MLNSLSTKSGEHRYSHDTDGIARPAAAVASSPLAARFPHETGLVQEANQALASMAIVFSVVAALPSASSFGETIRFGDILADRSPTFDVSSHGCYDSIDGYLR